MSVELEADQAEKCCANCGEAKIDDIKLIPCDKCDLVLYCSDECQKNHREEHEAICRERALEIREDILFRQPESSHQGDCPICFLPMSIFWKESVTTFCCGRDICGGCVYANSVREQSERLPHRCPFCRKLSPLQSSECAKIRDENSKKRAELNDPAALRHLGIMKDEEGDHESSFQFYMKAAALGDADSHYNLFHAYQNGEGVEKNEERAIFHAEEASIAGHPLARHSFALYEEKNKRYDRAIRHFIIASNLGYRSSITKLKELYRDGHVSKADFAAALRANQAAVDAADSSSRDEARINCHYRKQQDAMLKLESILKGMIR